MSILLPRRKKADLKRENVEKLGRQAGKIWAWLGGDRSLTTAKQLDLTLFYEGSSKLVLESRQEPSKLWFQFTDNYSVFDWGRMPDTIKNKGRALGILATYLFEQLNDRKLWIRLPQSQAAKRWDAEFLRERYSHVVYSGRSGLIERGLPTHFVRLTSERGDTISVKGEPKPIAKKEKEALFMEVLRAGVERPTSRAVLGQNIYFYRHTVSSLQDDRHPEVVFRDYMMPYPVASRRLIPLECVFRFGMPEGSSLASRIKADPTYAHKLGLKTVPEPGNWFDRPVIEFFSKLEAKDRHVLPQEAALLSGLNPEQFEILTELIYDIALALYTLFADQGLELWDGKIEFVHATHSNDRFGGVMLGDSIGPDELRIVCNGQHLSKEFLRKHYRGTKWEKSVKAAQAMSEQGDTRNWREIHRAEFGDKPEKLPHGLKSIVDQLYGVITNSLVGKPVFPNHPTLDDFVEQLKSKKL